MQRAFVQQGSWRIAVIMPCDATSQKKATVRVSALAGIAVLALMMAPDVKQELSAGSPPQVMVSTAPEIILAKSLERVPGSESDVTRDVTSSAPTRRWRSRADEIDVKSKNVVASDAVPQTAIEIVDSMTLRAGDMVVRLAGLAPQDEGKVCRRLDGLVVSCVDRAVSYLHLLVKGRSVTCVRAGVSADGIEKGQCRIGDTDIAEQMVRQGWAKADAEPEERFMLAQAAARKQKLGIWR